MSTSNQLCTSLGQKIVNLKSALYEVRAKNVYLRLALHKGLKH